MQGKLIVIDGPDASGKSTQVRLLYDSLIQSCIYKSLHQKGLVQGILTTHEPGATALGSKIRSLIVDEPMHFMTEVFLLMADRAQHIQSFVKPALEQGYWIISDRFIHSTIAYQGYGRTIDIDFISKLNDFVLTDTYPDMSIFLTIPPEEIVNRLKNKKKDRIEREDISFFEKVCQGFLDISQTYSIPTIDATLESISINALITEKVIEYLQTEYS